MIASTSRSPMGDGLIEQVREVRVALAGRMRKRRSGWRCRSPLRDLPSTASS